VAYFLEEEVYGFKAPQKKKGQQLTLLSINKNCLITTEKINDELSKKKKHLPFILYILYLFYIYIHFIYKKFENKSLHIIIIIIIMFGNNVMLSRVNVSNLMN
jgi:hypothetical protein